MTSGPPLEDRDELRAERSGLFLLSALLSIGLLAGSLLGPFSAPELLLRVLLTIVLFAAPSLSQAAGSARRKAVVASILSAATVLICAISALAGGTQSPEFSCLIAIPFMAGLILPQARAVVWGLGLVVLCFGCAMVLLTGAALSSVLMYAALLVAGTAAAALGTGIVRVLESRLAVEHARAEAAQQSADAERERSRSDRLALVGRLAAAVAHELSNPLTYLSSNLQLLEREADALQKGAHRDVHAAVADSARAVEQLIDILRDLRRFARSESVGAVAPTDIRALVEEALLSMSSRIRGIQVERTFAPSLPRVLVRRRRLVQVFVNLLFNAVDAVSAPEAKQRRVRISATEAEGTVTVQIEDTGVGLSAEARAHLFEPFFTTKGAGKGMGLGLALSREYVQADGGGLSIEEAPGGGVRAVVKLPVA